MKHFVLAFLALGGVIAAGAAQASLTSVDGGIGVYDSVNNVTWTSDGNLFKTQAAADPNLVAKIIAATAGKPVIGSINWSPNLFQTANGAMAGYAALAWVNYLNVINYGGSNQWYLPTTVDSSASFGYPDGNTGNPAVTSSQMAQLFYGQLGMVAGTPLSAQHNGSYALFSQIQDSVYWSGTAYGGDPTYGIAWEFWTLHGLQDLQTSGSNGRFAMAVTNGQLGAVPLPGSAWLLASSLLALGVTTRRCAPRPITRPISGPGGPS